MFGGRSARTRRDMERQGSPTQRVVIDSALELLDRLRPVVLEET